RGSRNGGAGHRGAAAGSGGVQGRGAPAACRIGAAGGGGPAGMGGSLAGNCNGATAGGAADETACGTVALGSIVVRAISGLESTGTPEAEGGGGAINTVRGTAARVSDSKV